MSDLITLFQQFERLGREWLEFSKETHGWACRTYGEDFVDCYFAATNDHRSVRFGDEWNCQIQIAFHDPVRFNDMTLQTVKNAEAIYGKAVALLAAEKERITNRTAEDAAREKAERIERLRLQLAELGAQP